MSIGRRRLRAPGGNRVRGPPAADAGESADFGFLQMRPLVLSREGEELRLDEVDPARLVCQSSKVLGNGRIDRSARRGRGRLPPLRTRAQPGSRPRRRPLQCEAERGGPTLSADRRGSLGIDRPWLGIPVAWDQISGARVIVEAGFRDFRVTPIARQPLLPESHCVSGRILHGESRRRRGLRGLAMAGDTPAVEEDGCVRHLQFRRSALRVVMNGRTSQGLIFKPERQRRPTILSASSTGLPPIVPRAAQASPACTARDSGAT